YVKNTGDSCLAVVAVLVLCMTVRVSFFHFISFHFISFHFISFHFISLIVLEIGGDYLKEPYDQSLSIDFAAFPAVLPDNGAYHKPIFHSTQFSSNLTKPHFDIFIN
ncbi:MAG TPA: hypothetical protein VIW25_07595, partial [Nitrososphaeraceae archaeon]